MPVPELAAALRDVLADVPPRSHAEREPHFFERWVDDEWGRQGHRHLAGALGGAASNPPASARCVAAQIAFDVSIRRALAEG